MNKLILCALGALSLLAAGCAKKEVKPLHTEPWLAHPPASAANPGDAGDAGLPRARYTITAPSQIHFDLPSKRGMVHGSLSHVTGELSLTPTALELSRGQVQVDLSSLSLSADGAHDASDLLARAKLALGLTGASPSPSDATATFELSALEDVAPALLEPAPASDAGAAFTRKARATAVGGLLLHGFRVLRRAPFEAELSFTVDRQLPASLVIRSRAPFVVSLGTHEIAVRDSEGARKQPKGAAVHPREARVSFELYGTKID
ncbi:MAG TPA: hypothetical protein VGL19_05005 [Polyangiaceae bacterium]